MGEAKQLKCESNCRWIRQASSSSPPLVTICNSSIAIILHAGSWHATYSFQLYTGYKEIFICFPSVGGITLNSSRHVYNRSKSQHGGFCFGKGAITYAKICKDSYHHRKKMDVGTNNRLRVHQEKRDCRILRTNFFTL